MAEGLARQIYSLQNNGVNGAPEIFDNEFVSVITSHELP